MTQQDACGAVSIVIFGASGDLTQRKLIPALYNLYVKQRFLGDFQIVGVSRTDFTHDAFRDKMREAVAKAHAEAFDAEIWEHFSAKLFYHPGDAGRLEDYHTLDAFLNEREADHHNRLFYLSTAPSLYESILENLGASGMTDEAQGWRRIVIEKPFGYDTASAESLNAVVHRGFAEHQVYRIDHYLGKETAQNLLFLRFANTIFEPIWNRNYIDNVQITVAESVDVGSRGDYYDQAGVLRDMFQNHLMQLLALTAMEPPISLEADHLRAEKAKVIHAIRTPRAEDAVRAQYEGYRETKGVAADSQTATYAALRLFIDNWRWQGVPFYLRSGKAMQQKASEIAIQFKRPPLKLFHGAHDEESPNLLAIHIQPNEGLRLRFEAKLPDQREGGLVDMEFRYADAFGAGAIPEAYERLLLDALLGDATLFAREDEIIASWRVIDAIFHAWEEANAPVETYLRGSWGPSAAEKLLYRDGFRWNVTCVNCDV